MEASGTEGGTENAAYVAPNSYLQVWRECRIRRIFASASAPPRATGHCPKLCAKNAAVRPAIFACNRRDRRLARRCTGPEVWCAQLSCSPRERRRARHRRERSSTRHARYTGVGSCAPADRHDGVRGTGNDRHRDFDQSQGSRAGRSGRAPAPSRTLCALVAAGAAVASARETIRVAYRRSHR